MNDSFEYARELMVAKRNDMLQNARFNLSVQEQRIVLFSVAQIKPEDTYLKEYVFDIKDFYTLCGIEKDTYTVLKRILKDLRDKSWWMPIKDEKGQIWESAVSWFTIVRTNKKSGKVKIKFHEDMMPYLLQLSKQLSEQGIYYTTYNLKYILPMQSKFSPRLYEILKSYQQNNVRWFFRVEDLKSLLCDCDKDCKPIVPETWKNFAEFKRTVLEPAVTEINKFTDLKIAYKTEKEGRKITKIHFIMLKKTDMEKREVDLLIQETLDGKQKQDIDQNDPFNILIAQHRMAVQQEWEAKAQEEDKQTAHQKKLKDDF